MRKIWFLGLFGFLSLIVLLYFKTQNALYFLWIFWVIWFVFFLPEKVIVEKIVKPLGESDEARTERRRSKGIVS